MALIKDCKSQDKDIMMMMMDKGCLTLNSTHPETMLLAKHSRLVQTLVAQQQRSGITCSALRIHDSGVNRAEPYGVAGGCELLVRQSSLSTWPAGSRTENMRCYTGINELVRLRVGSNGDSTAFWHATAMTGPRGNESSGGRRELDARVGVLAAACCFLLAVHVLAAAAGRGLSVNSVNHVCRRVRSAAISSGSGSGTGASEGCECS